MAAQATVYRFRIDFSDVDRGVYQELDLRVARHPSESTRYLLARLLAYCLCHEEGIAFSKGLSTTEEPALWIKDLQGRVTTWIEVGTPSAERLHKASKANPRVVVFTQHDPALIERAARERAIHRAEEIEVYALDPKLLDALEPLTERNAEWTVVHTEGMLYITAGAETLSGAVTRHRLAAG
jgi:uncharacterized protein YaeQ